MIENSKEYFDALNSADSISKDEQVFVKQLELTGMNDIILNAFNSYFKNKKIAYWAYIAKIEILDKNLKTIDPPHLCFIIKPTNKFVYEKHTEIIFEMIKPFFGANSSFADFVDFSIIGYQNSFQLDFNNLNKDNMVKIF